MPVIGDRPELNLKTVIYATDFSFGSKNAGLYAARMAAYFSAKLLVTHAFTLEQAALEVEVGDRRSSSRDGTWRIFYRERLIYWEQIRSRSFPHFWKEIRKM